MNVNKYMNITLTEDEMKTIIAKHINNKFNGDANITSDDVKVVIKSECIGIGFNEHYEYKLDKICVTVPIE